MIENEITRALENVNGIQINKSMDAPALMKEQAKLISIDKQLRQIRKVIPTLAEKCTEILRDLSLAVSVYLPKERRLGISYIIESLENLKYHLDCIRAQVEPAKEYKEERDELFKQVEEFEIARFRLNHGKKTKYEAEAEIIIDRDLVFEKLHDLNKRVLAKRPAFEFNYIPGVAVHV